MISIKDFINKLRIKKKFVFLLSGFTILSAAVFLFFFLSKKPKVTNEIPCVNWQERLGINLPSGFNFANDSLPINDSIFLTKLKKFLPQKKNVSKQMETVIKRAEQWFPVIESILKKNNLPEDLKYIAVTESRLNNAVSPRGAAGFWQLMRPTAIKYGLEINDNIDERLSVNKSTKAACKYLNEAHRQLGCWALAAAGYNLGINGVAKQVKIQNTKNYFDLDLNSETEAYVFKLIALKYVFENTREFGINIPRKNNSKPIFQTYSSDSSVIHLHALVTKYNLDFDLFKKMNPWMKNEKFNNAERKTYTFEYPKPYTLENFKKFLFKNETKDKDSITEFHSKS